jgi:hypothetical protein
MLIGPPKSRAGRRIVGIPEVIVPALREHLALFAEDDPGALVFPGAKGGPLRRGNFNKMSAWPHAVASIGMPGPHFHDLRHTGNQFAAYSGARLRDLMARTVSDDPRRVRSGLAVRRLTCAFRLEPVTGIEPALSAWESVLSGPVTWPDLRYGVSASGRERPLVTGVNGR